MKINTNNVDNVCEILHFVQNDTLFFLNDREKQAEKKYASLWELSKTEGDFISKPANITHRPADTSLKGRQTIEMPKIPFETAGISFERVLRVFCKEIVIFVEMILKIWRMGER